MAKKNRTPGQQVFRFVAIGCGVMFVIGLVVMVLGAVWVFSPGEQVETTAILDPAAPAAVRAVDLLEDEGARELIDHMASEIQSVNREMNSKSLPEEFQWLSNLQRAPRAKDFKTFIPKELAVTVDKDPSTDEIELVVAANFRQFVRPFRTMISMVHSDSKEGQQKYDYRGHEILPLGDAAVAFYGGTVLHSSKTAVLERVIDRLEDGTGLQAGAASANVELPPGDWDLSGDISDGDIAASVLAEIPPGGHFGTATPPSDGLLLGFGADFVSADEIRAASLMECGTVELATAWMSLLQPAWESRQASVESQGFNLDFEMTANGSQILTEVSLNGIEGRISEIMDQAIQIETSESASPSSNP